MRFDFSGTYLGLAGQAGGKGKVSVAVVKEWNEVASFQYNHSLHAMAWGPFARSFYAAAHDGGVVVYGAK